MNLRALMQQLQERMLTGARFSPDHSTSVPAYRQPISPDKLAVALHVRLLEIGWKANQVFGIRQDHV